MRMQAVLAKDPLHVIRIISPDYAGVRENFLLHHLFCSETACRAYIDITRKYIS